MVWFRRIQQDASHVSTQQDLATRPGSALCSFGRCTEATGLACEYVDRRGRACTTAWCPNHRIIVEGHVYCRRHAGVVLAIPDRHSGSTLAVPLPDLENRAPSLVNWVGNDLDGDIQQVLLREIEINRDGEIIVDPVTLVSNNVERTRVWIRSWKLVNHQGVIVRITAGVEEELDAEVNIRVNGTGVYRGIPPWIGQRLLQRPISPEVDADRRVEFHNKIIDAVVRGIDRDRALRSFYDEGS